MITNFRKVNKYDILKGHLNLYTQLTKIDPSHISKTDYENFINSLSDDHIIYVVESKNKIIGTITILIEQKLIHDMGKVAHIEDVVVDTNYRGYDIGTTLIKMAVEHAREQKCYKIILDCSETLKQFYGKCGFVHKGVEMALYF